MEKKIIITIIKDLLQKIASYLNKEVLKGACLRAFESFKEVLWKEIKEEVKTIGREVITDAEIFLTSLEAQEKEEVILNTIMEKIKLPLVLKPFKGIIKKIIKNKLEEFVKEALEKGKEFVG